MSLTPAEVLVVVRGHVIQDRVRPTRHAQERMRERNVSYVGLRLLLQTATTATLQENQRWMLSGGRDQDGEAARVVVIVHEHTVVVTVLE